MTSTQAMYRPHWGSRSTTFGVALLTWSLLFAATSSRAGGQDRCGEISFSFDGTRLLNDNISNSAGPFPADIPAGVYTVTLVAADEHDTQVGVAGQAGEQYRVVLNSGYVSPLSTDIPDEVNTTTTVFHDQQIGESTSISVEHGGAEGINSVDVVCVGFTPVAPPAPTEEPLNEEPADDEVRPDSASSEPEDEIDPVEELIETNEEPIQDIGDPVEVNRDPVQEPSTEADDEQQETEVLNDSVSRDATDETEEAVVPLLAITGPGNHAAALVSLGLLMIASGGFLVHRERRIRTTR